MWTECFTHKNIELEMRGITQWVRGSESVPVSQALGRAVRQTPRVC